MMRTSSKNIFVPLIWSLFLFHFVESLESSFLWLFLFFQILRSLFFFIFFLLNLLLFLFFFLFSFLLLLSLSLHFSPHRLYRIIFWIFRFLVQLKSFFIDLRLLTLWSFFLIEPVKWIYIMCGIPFEKAAWSWLVIFPTRSKVRMIILRIKYNWYGIKTILIIIENRR